MIWLWRTACFDFRGNSIQNQSALNDAAAAAATSAMLTAMACCPLPTGRVGHGSAPWRVTDASEGPLLRCCEGAWESQRGGRPTWWLAPPSFSSACALRTALCLTRSPQLLLLLFAAALRQHAGGLERITEASSHRNRCARTVKTPGGPVPALLQNSE